MELLKEVELLESYSSEELTNLIKEKCEEMNKLASQFQNYQVSDENEDEEKEKIRGINRLPGGFIVNMVKSTWHVPYEKRNRAFGKTDLLFEDFAEYVYKNIDYLCSLQQRIQGQGMCVTTDREYYDNVKVIFRAISYLLSVWSGCFLTRELNYFYIEKEERKVSLFQIKKGLYRKVYLSMQELDLPKELQRFFDNYFLSEVPDYQDNKLWDKDGYYTGKPEEADELSSLKAIMALIFLLIMYLIKDYIFK